MKQNQAEAIKHDDFGKVLRKWWQGLEDDKGGRALLRRARQTLDVAACPAFHRLRWAIGELGHIDTVRLSMIAMAAARVERILPSQTLAKTMAQAKEGGSNPRVSGLRFRRLIQIDDRRELWGPLRRILALVDNTADIATLAQDLYFWGPKVKIRWAEDYYDIAKSAE